MMPIGLPIEPVLPDLLRALEESGSAVLQAPTGAGKTTLVPLALLEAPWLVGRKILLLEPRRLAARAAARRMAELLGEPLGVTVGYRIRRESVVGPGTRIEVVTEGILTRMLQDDPGLESAGVVIFDEFHERSVHADLGLALTIESRSLLRPDLKILIMSATLDGEPIADLLGDAPIVTSTGQSFPVDVMYLPRRSDVRLEAATASAVRQALVENDGDILVFLPGQGEIRRTAELLGTESENWRVYPLYGNLSQAEQDAALRPDRSGRRKVVLSTSIAETSLTIAGVRVVIDSGLARVPKFSPGSGMTRLVTVRVSRASAEQRRGRAGRTAPGRCYRLWAAAEDHQLLPRTTPEIIEAALAPVALELAVRGVNDATDLAWLDPPPPAALAEARALLRQLGAIDATDRVTDHGRRMASLGTDPRLAHLLVAGAELGSAEAAAQLTALLEERDPLRGAGGPPDADIQLRLDLIAERETPALYHGYEVDRGALHRIRESAGAWRRALPTAARARRGHAAEPPSRRAVESTGFLLALAYPDRVGQRRPGQAGRFLLRNGQGVSVDSPVLGASDFIVAAELDGDRRESRVWLGATLSRDDLERHFGEEMETEDVIEWDEQAEAVVAVRRDRLGAMVLVERPLPDPDSTRVRAVLVAWIRRAGLGVLPWSEASTALRARLGFLHQVLGASWPSVSDEALLESLEEWLGPRLDKIRKRRDLARLDLSDALLGRLDWERRRALDDLAPAHLTVPSGSRIRVDYSDPGAPVLAVRLQEVFGLEETPQVGGGRIPVTLHLLSPAHRPVQVTRDLAGFWRTSYFDVRKEMKGRYPKHEWPEDPVGAVPTKRAKRRER